MNDIEKILKENGIIVEVTTGKVGFDFFEDIDLTDESKDNLRAMQHYPDSIVCSCDSEGIPDDFDDATVAISYPNDMAMLKRVYEQLHEIKPMAFATLIIEAIINGDERVIYPMSNIEKILKENGIIVEITTGKVGFDFFEDMDMTNEPKDNLRAMRYYPDPVVSSRHWEGSSDFEDSTVTISYPNDMAMLKRIHKQLHDIKPMGFHTLIVEAVINGNVMHEHK